MKPSLRKRITFEYPEWQNKPLQLSNAELANPYTVLNEVFQMYGLREARVYLKNMLEDALSAEDVYPLSHLTLHDNLERLVEAAYVLHEQHSIGGGITDSEEKHQEGGPSNQDNNTIAPHTCEKKEERFSKGKLLLERLRENSTGSLVQIFSTLELEDLANALHTWLNVALSNDRSMYEEGAQRADLIQFMEKLYLLIEALYIKSELLKLPDATTWEEELPLSLQNELLRKGIIRHLSRDQMSSIRIVLKDFFQIFTITYVRTELWDLLDALVSSPDHHFTLDRFNLLLYYDCVVCLVEAAWLIHGEPEANERTAHPISNSLDPDENNTTS